MNIGGFVFWVIVVLGLAWEVPDAAKTDKEAAELESNNLALRPKMQPRTISPQQFTNFIVLTHRIKKTPIAVSIGQEGFDTETFAYQLRQMFTAAGFRTNDGALAWGINRDPTRLYALDAGEWENQPHGDFAVLVPPEKMADFMGGTFDVVTVNGLMMPVTCTTNEAIIYAEI